MPPPAGREGDRCLDGGGFDAHKMAVAVRLEVLDRARPGRPHDGVREARRLDPELTAGLVRHNGAWDAVVDPIDRTVEANPRL